MPTSRLVRIALALVVAASVIWLGRSRRPAPAATTSDTRQAVAVPAGARDAVIAEMNTMLRSVNGVLGGAQRGDTAAVRAAAAASGMAMAADPELERLLPAAWTELAEAVHGGFDSLRTAVAAARTAQAARDSATIRLVRITASCVACHATYRLAVR